MFHSLKNKVGGDTLAAAAHWQTVAEERFHNGEREIAAEAYSVARWVMNIDNYDALNPGGGYVDEFDSALVGEVG